MLKMPGWISPLLSPPTVLTDIDQGSSIFPALYFCIRLYTQKKRNLYCPQNLRDVATFEEILGQLKIIYLLAIIHLFRFSLSRGNKKLKQAETSKAVFYF
mmetsp:Transcript_22211/g.33697  ORF Transcript_22211/g.33697 Transcript_22211/m.33697 type:complete len:100 (-) Transcript_22211:50-349(-)